MPENWLLIATLETEKGSSTIEFLHNGRILAALHRGKLLRLCLPKTDPINEEEQRQIEKTFQFQKK